MKFEIIIMDILAQLYLLKKKQQNKQQKNTRIWTDIYPCTYWYYS